MYSLNMPVPMPYLVSPFRIPSMTIFHLPKSYCSFKTQVQFYILYHHFFTKPALNSPPSSELYSTLVCVIHLYLVPVTFYFYISLYTIFLTPQLHYKFQKGFKIWDSPERLLKLPVFPRAQEIRVQKHRRFRRLRKQATKKIKDSGNSAIKKSRTLVII